MIYLILKMLLLLLAAGIIGWLLRGLFYRGFYEEITETYRSLLSDYNNEKNNLVSLRSEGEKEKEKSLALLTESQGKWDILNTNFATLEKKSKSDNDQWEKKYKTVSDTLKTEQDKYTKDEKSWNLKLKDSEKNLTTQKEKYAKDEKTWNLKLKDSEKNLTTQKEKYAKDEKSWNLKLKDSEKNLTTQKEKYAKDEKTWNLKLNDSEKNLSELKIALETKVSHVEAELSSLKAESEKSINLKDVRILELEKQLNEMLITREELDSKLTDVSSNYSLLTKDFNALEATYNTMKIELEEQNELIDSEQKDWNLKLSNLEKEKQKLQNEAKQNINNLESKEKNTAANLAKQIAAVAAVNLTIEALKKDQNHKNKLSEEQKQKFLNEQKDWNLKFNTLKQDNEKLKSSYSKLESDHLNAKKEISEQNELIDSEQKDWNLKLSNLEKENQRLKDEARQTINNLESKEKNTAANLAKQIAAVAAVNLTIETLKKDQNHKNKLSEEQKQKFLNEQKDWNLKFNALKQDNEKLKNSYSKLESDHLNAKKEISEQNELIDSEQKDWNLKLSNLEKENQRLKDEARQTINNLESKEKNTAANLAKQIAAVAAVNLTIEALKKDQNQKNKLSDEQKQKFLNEQKDWNLKFNALKQDNEKLKNSYSKLESDHLNAKKEISEQNELIDSEQKDWNLKLSNLEKENQRLKDQAKQTINNLESKEKNTAANLAKQIAAVAAVNLTIEALKKDQNHKNKLSEEQKQKFLNEQKDWNLKFNTLKQDNEKLKNNYSKLESDHLNAKKEISEQNELIDSEQKDWNLKLSNLEKEKQKFINEQKDWNLKFNTLKQDNEKLKNSYSKLENDHLNAKKEISEQNELIDSEQKDWNLKLGNLNQQITSLKGENEQKLKNLSLNNASLLKELEESKAKNVTQINEYRLLNDNFTIIQKEIAELKDTHGFTLKTSKENQIKYRDAIQQLKELESKYATREEDFIISEKLFVELENKFAKNQTELEKKTHDYLQLQKRSDSLDKDIAELNKMQLSFNQFKTDYAHLKIELEKSQNAEKQQSQKLVSLEQKLKTATKEFEQSAANYNNEKKTWSIQMQSQQKEYQEVKVQFANLNKNKGALEQELGEWKNKFEGQNKVYLTLNQKFEAQKRTLTTFENKYNQTIQISQKKEADYKLLSNNFKDLELKYNNQKQESATSGKLVIELQNKYSSYQKLQEKQNSDLIALQKRYAELEAQNKEFSAIKLQLTNLQSQYKETQIVFTQLEQNHQSLEANYQMAQKNLNVCSEARRGLEMQINKQRQAQMSGVQMRTKDTPILFRKRPSGKIDDLKVIKGIGVVLEKMLHDLGVYFFWQISEWTETEVEYVDTQLEVFKGRIARDVWVSQALDLKELKTSVVKAPEFGDDFMLPAMKNDINNRANA